MRILVATLVLTTFLLAAGTVARSVLDWHDRPIVGWSCPDCGTRNAGDPEASFDATCRRCHGGFSWRYVMARRPAPSDIMVAAKEAEANR